jgi:hypothetical protein
LKIVQKTDNNITPNKWILSLIKSISIRLNGQIITLYIPDKPEYSSELSLLKMALSNQLNNLDPNLLSGVKITEVHDSNNPKDLLVEIDYSGYQETVPLASRDLVLIEGLNLNFRDAIKLWVKDIYFNDWKTTSNIQIRWKDHGLSVRIPFESTGHEITAAARFFGLPLGAKVNIDDFYFDIHLVPHIFWFPNLAPARDKTGKQIAKFDPAFPTDVWASGKDMYKHCCTVFLDCGWSSFSPNIYDVENQLKKAIVENLEKFPILFQSYSQLLFQLFANFLLGVPISKMRGIHIQPNNAQFLYLDEEEETFTGKGRIVAVRKNAISNHRKNNKDKNIIEVEIEDENGKHIRISTLNLIESMLDKKAKIDNAHPVIRNKAGYSANSITGKPIWGQVQAPRSGNEWVYLPDAVGGPRMKPDYPWEGIIPRKLDICRYYEPALELKFNGYLRSNPDNQARNNLDNLPTYTYDRSNPLNRNIYDGSFLFAYPHWPNPSGLQRHLFPRKWKFPSYHDREHKLLRW